MLRKGVKQSTRKTNNGGFQFGVLAASMTSSTTISSIPNSFDVLTSIFSETKQKIKREKVKKRKGETNKGGFEIP